ncbi:hypothetical protein [Hydrogenophaga palleronii]|nr:hypothetical protein [Hydrogenophaga palleronii]
MRRGANYLINKVALWSREDWGVDVQEGMDDITLALVADAWSRTGRVSVRAESASPGTARLRSGMPIAVDAARLDAPRLPLAPALKPLQQLDRSLCEIEQRFGAARREWVVLEMEYSDAPGCI